MKSKKIGFIFSVFFILSLSPFVQSCSSIPKDDFEVIDSVPLEQKLLPQTIHWETINNNPGFQTITYKVKEQKVTWTCVKIDLTNTNLELIIQPSEKNEIYTLNSVQEFAKQNKTIVAINTTPFDNVDKTYKPWGITKFNDKIISPWVNREDYAALAFYKKFDGSYNAKLLCPQKDFLIEAIDFDYIIGGFFQILKDEEILKFESIRRSRTACGIDERGETLYLFAVTPNFSLNDRNGLTYEECALILKKLGCSNALQFDGGHSTGLCINSKTIRKPIFQRKIPCIFGIKEN